MDAFSLSTLTKRKKKDEQKMLNGFLFNKSRLYLFFLSKGPGKRFEYVI